MTVSRHRDLLTTSEVARACHVSATQVRRWVDTGLLAATRMPGSKHRRVRRNDLVAFMKQHGLDCLLQTTELT